VLVRDRESERADVEPVGRHPGTRATPAYELKHDAHCERIVAALLEINSVHARG